MSADQAAVGGQDRYLIRLPATVVSVIGSTLLLVFVIRTVWWRKQRKQKQQGPAFSSSDVSANYAFARKHAETNTGLVFDPPELVSVQSYAPRRSNVVAEEMLTEPEDSFFNDGFGDGSSADDLSAHSSLSGTGMPLLAKSNIGDGLQYTRPVDEVVAPVFTAMSTIVAMISIADLIALAGFLIPFRQDMPSWVCTMQASLLHFGQVASAMWTCCLALVLAVYSDRGEHSTLISPKRGSTVFLAASLICWGLATITLIQLLAYNQLGFTGIWCWITPGPQRLSLAYAPLWLTMLVSLLVVIKQGRALRRMNFLRHMVIMPLAYILLWTPGSLNRIFELAGSPSPILATIHDAWGPAQGFINAGLYGMTLYRVAPVGARPHFPKAPPKSMRDKLFIGAFFATVVLLRGSLQTILKTGGSVGPPLSLFFGSRVLGLAVATAINAVMWYKDNNYRLQVRAMLNWPRVRNAAVMSLLNIVFPVILYNYSLDFGNVQPGVATVLTSTIPLLIALISMYTTPGGKKAMSKKKATGIALGFVGVLTVCISTVEGAQQKTNTAGVQSGGLVALWYVVFYVGVIMQACALIFWRRVNVPDPDGGSLQLGKAPAVVMIWMQNFVGFCVGTLGILLVDLNFSQGEFGPHFEWLPKANVFTLVFVLAWLGIVAGIIAGWAYYELQARTSPLTTGATTYLQPLVSQIESIIIFHVWEGVAWQFKVIECGGGALVILGLVLCITG